MNLLDRWVAFATRHPLLYHVWDFIATWIGLIWIGWSFRRGLALHKDVRALVEQSALAVGRRAPFGVVAILQTIRLIYLLRVQVWALGFIAQIFVQVGAVRLNLWILRARNRYLLIKLAYLRSPYSRPFDYWIAFVQHMTLLHRAWSRLVVLPLSCLRALWRFSAVRVRLQEQRKEIGQIAHWLRNKAVFVYGWIGISWRFRDAVPGAVADHLRDRLHQQSVEAQALYEWIHYGLTYPVPVWSRRNPASTWNALRLTAPWRGIEKRREAVRGIIAHVATGNYEQVVALKDHLDEQDRQSRRKPWWQHLPLPNWIISKLAYAYMVNFMCKGNNIRLPFGGVAALWLYAQPFNFKLWLYSKLDDFIAYRRLHAWFPYSALTEFLVTGDSNIMRPDQDTPAESRQLARLVNMALGGAVVALVALCAVGATFAPVGLNTIQQAAIWARACATGWLK